MDERKPETAREIMERTKRELGGVHKTGCCECGGPEPYLPITMVGCGERVCRAEGCYLKHVRRHEMIDLFIEASDREASRE